MTEIKTQFKTTKEGPQKTWEKICDNGGRDRVDAVTSHRILKSTKL